MLRLLPNPTAEKSADAATLRPSALVYTLLRHGRDLPHAEAERRLRQCMEALEPAAETGPYPAA